MCKTLMSALLLGLLPLAAYADGPMKQGLWEMTMKSDQMKAMPKLSPEQMEMMRQRGIQIPQMSDGGMVTKVCVSKEMAQRDTPPAMSHGMSDCQPKNPQKSGNTFTSDIVCNGPNMQGTGTTKVTYTGDGFTSVSDFKGTARGQPINNHSETSGKYLGPDCGSVKPLAMPSK